MSIYWLGEELVFPDHRYADEDGVLALGGDLSVERLLLAYYNGIFPWFNEGDPIIWWSPPERFVLYIENLKIPTSLKKFLKKNPYKITFDKAFSEVINNCREARIETGTWITDEMVFAYEKLHDEGFAHSVEVWFEEKLIGGLYGVSIGRSFCGESMFTLMNNGSKIALVELCKVLQPLGFKYIDCQVHTPHLEKLGAINVSRKVYLRELKEVISKETLRGTWESITLK